MDYLSDSSFTPDYNPTVYSPMYQYYHYVECEAMMAYEYSKIKNLDLISCIDASLKRCFKQEIDEIPVYLRVKAYRFICLNYAEPIIETIFSDDASSVPRASGEDNPIYEKCFSDLASKAIQISKDYYNFLEAHPEAEKSFSDLFDAEDLMLGTQNKLGKFINMIPAAGISGSV